MSYHTHTPGRCRGSGPREKGALERELGRRSAAARERIERERERERTQLEKVETVSVAVFVMAPFLIYEKARLAEREEEEDEVGPAGAPALIS